MILAMTDVATVGISFMDYKPGSVVVGTAAVG